MYCYHCISTLHVAGVNEWPLGGEGISNGNTYYTYNQPSLSFPFTPLIVHAGCMQPFPSKSQHTVAAGVASLCETSSPFQCQPVHPTLRTTAGEAELTQCIKHCLYIYVCFNIQFLRKTVFIIQDSSFIPNTNYTAPAIMHSYSHM